MNPFEEITKYLDSAGVQYEILEHLPVYTGEEAAKVRGVSMSQGAKSLLLKANNDYVLVILPANQKLDSKKLKKLLNAERLRFATPEEVKAIMRCEIGSCYPFGNLINVKMLVDTKFSKNDIIFFSPGVHDRSIKIKCADYLRAVGPDLVDVV